MSNAQRFMAAFRGFDAAHGQTFIMGTKKNGKEEARSRIIREPLTKELIDKHLKGETGVGSIPITKEHTCCFGVIDVDTYPLDHVALGAKCNAISLPSIVCRSKSGGAHIYFFIKGWISATDMRDKLAEIAAVLGYGGSEIFPKQTQLLVERGDWREGVHNHRFVHVRIELPHIVARIVEVVGEPRAHRLLGLLAVDGGHHRIECLGLLLLLLHLLLIVLLHF